MKYLRSQGTWALWAAGGGVLGLICPAKTENHVGAAGTAKSWVCVQRVTCTTPNVTQFGWKVSDLTLDENKYNVSAACKQIL